VLMISMSQIANRLWITANADEHYYIYPISERPIPTEGYTMRSTLSFSLILNGLIPLDLAVTITIVKGLYTIWIAMDVEMIEIDRSEEDERIVGCDIKNLTMTEDLSKVNHIFCDKTGTLTQNLLKFKALGINKESFFLKDSS
jgi:P-type E1-E2 ATPase